MPEEFFDVGFFAGIDLEEVFLVGLFLLPPCLDVASFCLFIAEFLVDFRLVLEVFEGVFRGELVLEAVFLLGDDLDEFFLALFRVVPDFAAFGFLFDAFLLGDVLAAGFFVPDFLVPRFTALGFFEVAEVLALALALGEACLLPPRLDVELAGRELCLVDILDAVFLFAGFEPLGLGCLTVFGAVFWDFGRWDLLDTPFADGVFLEAILVEGFVEGRWLVGLEGRLLEAGLEDCFPAVGDFAFVVLLLFGGGFLLTVLPEAGIFFAGVLAGAVLGFPKDIGHAA